MKEILPGVFLITQRSLISPLKPTVHIYVIAGPNGLVFDAGYGDRRSVRRFVKEFKAIGDYCRFRNIPFNVKRIIPSHTHVDHFSGLAGISKALELSILATAPMAEKISSEIKYREAYDYQNVYGRYVSGSTAMRRLFRMAYPLMLWYYRHLFGIRFVGEPVRIIPEKTEIDVNGSPWTVFPSPGHCEDHISLYDPYTGILFAGDNVLRTVTTWLGPPNSNMDRYITSLQVMLELPKLEIILPAHGKPVDHPRRRIRELIDWRNLRKEQVLSIVRNDSSGITVKGILKTLYPSGAITKRFLASGWVILTLMQCEEEGKVRRMARGPSILYFPR